MDQRGPASIVGTGGEHSPKLEQRYSQCGRGSGTDGLSTLNPSRAMAYLIQQANRFGTIHQRFALTAYGRGIENPLDIRAVTDADGNVDMITGFSIRSFRRSAAISSGMVLIAGNCRVAVAVDTS